MRKLIERWSLRIRLIFVLLKLTSSYTNEHDTSPFGLHLQEERRQEHHLTKDTEISWGNEDNITEKWRTEECKQSNTIAHDLWQTTGHFERSDRTVRGIQSPSKPVAWNLKWLFFPNFTNMKDLKITHLMIDKKCNRLYPWNCISHRQRSSLVTAVKLSKAFTWGQTQLKLTVVEKNCLLI